MAPRQHTKAVCPECNRVIGIRHARNVTRFYKHKNPNEAHPSKRCFFSECIVPEENIIDNWEKGR